MQRDTSTLLSGVEDIVTKYNELVDLIDEEAYSSDSVVEDVSSLKTVMSSIKNLLFSNYGANDNQNVFNYGFELDKSGHLSLNSETFSDAITNNFDDLKELFIGAAENKGLGTQLKEFMDELNGYEGMLTLYDDNRESRKVDLDEEKEAAVEDLDSKYSYLASQFASYGAAIAQMEASFGGLKMMIEQSVSSN
jgi:flagellar hook-associated protein 2